MVAKGGLVSYLELNVRGWQGGDLFSENKKDIPIGIIENTNDTCKGVGKEEYSFILNLKEPLGVLNKLEEIWGSGANRLEKKMKA